MSSRDLNAILNRYTESNVRIKKSSKREALREWEEPVRCIINNVAKRDRRFQMQEVMPGGSFYERLKVKEANEFDIMLVLKEPGFVSYVEEPDPYVPSPIPKRGFVTIKITGHYEQTWQHNGCLDLPRKLLNAVQVKNVFYGHVRGAVKELGYSHFIKVKSQGPAVTLKITSQSSSREYSIDLTLAFRFSSSPDYAREWVTRQRHGWPSQELVSLIHGQGCHVVAKPPKPELYSGQENDRKLLWRYSLTKAEKTLFLEGGHGQPASCRKQVLRILKALREDLALGQLKSYYLKTIVMYECEAYPHPYQWNHDQLQYRFQSAVNRLLHCLKQKNCPHYFIQGLNLFEGIGNCELLIQRVQQLADDPRPMIEQALKK